MQIPSNWSELCTSNVKMLGLSKYAFRRDYSAAKLGFIGFPNIDFVDALDGFDTDEVSIDAALKTLTISCKPTLGKGEKACTYSHVSLWKKMIDANLPYMIVFEDDCLGHLDLPKGLGQRFWDATPKDFDIVYLGNMMNPSDSLLDDKTNLVVSVPAQCLHAYILSLKGAKKLISFLDTLHKMNEQIHRIDIQLTQMQVNNTLRHYCWNGTLTQKSYPTYDDGLPWQAFSDIITPVKDTGLFWQNMRLGSSLEQPQLKFLHTL